MREKKTKLLVGILLSLVLFTSSAALLMYSKQSRIDQEKTGSIELFVSTKSIKAGEMIGAEEIKKTSLSKEYGVLKPLAKEDIIGKYATSDILYMEPIRSEKLSLTKPKEEKAAEASDTQKSDTASSVTQIDSDTVSISLNVFKNIDYSLKAGDYIDIVSIFPKKDKNKEYEFETKYIALHVKINALTFASVPQPEDKNKKAPVASSNTVVLSMKPKEIKNLLDLYYAAQYINSQRVYNENNKGHLWMVKCSQTVDAKAEVQKKAMLVDAKKYGAPSTSRSSNSVSISYEK